MLPVLLPDQADSRIEEQIEFAVGDFEDARVGARRRTDTHRERAETAILWKVALRVAAECLAVIRSGEQPNGVAVFCEILFAALLGLPVQVSHHVVSLDGNS